ncbi:MAG: CHASE domain-containing protein, partial [Betaproteobacteria bacterium]
EQARLRAVFDANARQTAGRIEQRISNYEQMLRGVQGLFSASDGIDPVAFRTYVDTVMAGPDAAGLQSVAFTGLLKRDELPAYVERMRRQGHPDVQVRPAGEREMYAPLAMVAPDSSANRTVIGYDSLSDATRRNAMLQARDSGNATLTALVQLRADAGPDLKAGCLLYLPVYAKGAATSTVAERRAHGIGWVRAAFRVGDLMSTLYGEQSPGLVVRLHDGTDTGEATLMYSSVQPGDPVAAGDEPSRQPRFRAQEYVSLAGHTWTVQLSSLPEFERVHERNASTVILVAGVVLSLLLAVITHQLVTGRARAYAVAQAMTRELRASEERYRRIVETAGEGIWLLDAAHHIAFVNPRIAQWLGIPEAAMQGRPVDDFMDADEAARCRAALEAQGEGEGGGGTIELRLRRIDGSAMWVSLSMRPIVDDAGRPSGALGMLTDINERRLAEERRAALETQLRDAQKMEAIGTLAGGIAHDFNNILAAIIGNVAAARQDAAIGLSGDPSLAQIERAAMRARSLVQQILAFSRMQAQELHTQALQPVIEETLDMLRAAIPAQVELRVSLPEAPVHVRADATQIEQIVMNLCTNAWHALPGGRGRIEVGLAVDEAAREGADARALAPAGVRGARAHLWIADNGSGMDEATRARVFEPFFTTKQVGKGTGLGLAVVHGIVSVHGGAIHVDSALGVGSRFDLWFPLQDAPAQAFEPTHAMANVPRGSGERVLVVDDDPAMVLMVDGLLKRAGYRVTVYEQPVAALARVVADPSAFDIVVTDFNMPEMNGMELATALARIAPELPVIITSGFISDEMRQQAGALRVAALLQKEYTLERLAALVHSVLELHRDLG